MVHGLWHDNRDNGRGICCIVPVHWNFTKIIISGQTVMAQCSRICCHLPEQGEDPVDFDIAGSVCSVSIEGFNRGNKITVLQGKRKFTGNASRSPCASPIITFLFTIYRGGEYNNILLVIARASLPWRIIPCSTHPSRSRPTPWKADSAATLSQTKTTMQPAGLWQVNVLRVAQSSGQDQAMIVRVSGG